MVQLAIARVKEKFDSENAIRVRFEITWLGENHEFLISLVQHDRKWGPRGRTELSRHRVRAFDTVESSRDDEKIQN